MARKVVNCKVLREQAEAAEAAEKAAPKKKKAAKKKAAKKKTAKRASRSAAQVDVRKKVFWCVFNQSMKRVATFEFHQKKDAQKKAAELSKAGKSAQPHFVQKVKEELVEE